MAISFYESLVRPVLFQLDPEKAHTLVCGAMEMAQRSDLLLRILSAYFTVDDPRLHSNVAGLNLGAVGLAAGFDKEAKLPPFIEALGFGHVEVGTITQLEQLGNPTPRLFRLAEDESLINRMGFNNAGADNASVNLEEAAKKTTALIGINIGKSKITPLEDAVRDYVYSAERLAPFASYVVVNVSSPNTEGLRGLQNKKPLMEILYAVKETAGDKPVFVKIAPDLEITQADDVIYVVNETGISGIIATNTTIFREGLVTNMARLVDIGNGGLSGPILRGVATDIVKHIYRETNGELPVIGVGGISSAEDAYERILAGASSVQLYTAFPYKGPSVARDINLGLLKLLERDGYASIQEAVGKGN